MSKRDGKMYMVMMLSKTVGATSGLEINCETDVFAGIMNVFWTKTAARKAHGRKVVLCEIRLASPPLEDK